MPRHDDPLIRNFQRLQAEARRRRVRQDAEVLREMLREEEKAKQPPRSLHIVVHEYYCPDCKHRMWSEDSLAKNTECSLCGFRGDFRKRED
jgi:hypothetical protein